MARIKRTYLESISILGLSTGASPEEIKDAYRKLAKQYHPDVYQTDSGEKFKEINSAYRFLKKHPDPPENPTYRRSQQSNYYPPQDDYVQKRRAYYRQKRARQAQSQREMYQWMIKKVKPFVLTVLVFNIFLALDYILPHINEESRIIKYSYNTSRKSVLDPNETTYEYSILLDNNQLNKFQANRKGVVKIGGKYTLKKSIFFGTTMKLVHHKSGEELTPPYDVYRIFGFIIPFVFLSQYLYFYKLKNYDLRLGLVAFMIFAVLMQISLTFF
ncbi:MAG: J domain-containing protein [Bacteroidota bacterium]